MTTCLRSPRRPWRLVVATRNQLIHDYLGLDNDTLCFCGHEPVLQLYKRLCRHYWDIDPAAAADYIKAYREHWDNEERGEPKTP